MKTYQEHKALVEALKPIPTNNEGRGYHGEGHDLNGEERDKKFAHAFTDLAKHVQHLPGVTSKHVRNYLDSTHGRHMGGHKDVQTFIDKHHGSKAKFEKSFKDIQRQTADGHFPE